MKALRTAVRTCKNYKVRINAVMALSALQQRSDLGLDTALAEVVEDLVEATTSVPSWVELTDLKYNDALNVQVRMCSASSWNSYHVCQYLAIQILATLLHLLRLTTVSDLAQLLPCLRNENNREMLRTQFQRHWLTIDSDPDSGESSELLACLGTDHV